MSVEAFERVSIPALLATVSSTFARGSLEIETVALSQDAALVIPRHAVEQALAALIRNALEASPADSLIRVRVEEDAGLVRFVVKDSGSGAPFSATEVRALADRLGGRLILKSRAGVGTTAIFELPMTVARAGAGE